MQMLNFSAFQAFGVKMLLAVARRTYVFINIAIFFLIAERPQNILTAKLPQPTVQTTFSRLGISVELKTKLFHRKLTVRIGLKKVNQSPSAFCLIHFP